MNEAYPSYTYFIRWSEYDKQYYGVRSGNKCAPEDDLLIHYFTSSPPTKEFMREHGMPDIVRIDKTFDNSKDARDYELHFLRENNVVNDDRWLNRSHGSPPIRNKPHTKETKKKMSDASKGEKNHMFGKKGKLHHNYGMKHTPESIQKMRDALANGNHPCHGKTFEEIYGEEEAKIKRKTLSEKKLGEGNPMYGKSGAENPIFTGYYITPWGKFASTVEFVENSPIYISGDTLRGYCKKNNQKIISRQAVSQSNFLTKDMIGKTFKEIGFDFEPAKNKSGEVI